MAEHSPTDQPSRLAAPATKEVKISEERVIAAYEKGDLRKLKK
jgi:hypothetical protein